MTERPWTNCARDPGVGVARVGLGVDPSPASSGSCPLLPATTASCSLSGLERISSVAGRVVVSFAIFQPVSAPCTKCAADDGGNNKPVEFRCRVEYPSPCAGVSPPVASARSARGIGADCGGSNDTVRSSRSRHE